ncbi:MAG: sulfotransferase [Marinibacterium sp.]|nr:sulfotransferase [Marinibacterium sp.]
MSRRFDSICILGTMRSGSNLLERQLASLPDVQGMGELFNPAFIGAPAQGSVLGMDRAARDAAPLALLDRVRAAPGLPVFRYFQGHDPRVLDGIIRDPRCAKLVLTRAPLDSFLSLGIARATGQWILTDSADRKAHKIRFDADAYHDYLGARAAFYDRIEHALQTAGQAAFRIGYTDLQDTDCQDGLLRWLGIGGQIRRSTGLQRQNPGAAADKVTNPDALAEVVGIEAGFARAGPAVRRWPVLDHARLLILPLADRAHDALAQAAGPARRGLSQSQLRDWWRAHPDHRGIAVLRHPVWRAYDAFRADGGQAGDRAAFLAAIEHARQARCYLGAKTLLPAWRAQGALLADMAPVASPDHILREEQLPRDLPGLLPEIPPYQAPDPPPDLWAIYDDRVERAVRATYRRDYDRFGIRSLAETCSPGPSAGQAALTVRDSVRIV